MASGQFSYYLLVLSWDDCFAIIVDGLWRQYPGVLAIGSVRIIPKQDYS